MVAVDPEKRKDELFNHLMEQLQQYPSSADEDRLTQLCHAYNSHTENPKLFGLSTIKTFKMGDLAREILDSEEHSALEIIFSKGYPTSLMECRECLTHQSHENFRFYRNRVDKNGYYIRLNAICKTCEKTLNDERQNTLQREHENIPPRPRSGDICPSCNREHRRGWHRDHDPVTHKFLGWKCHICNMKRHDQRSLYNQKD